MKENHLYYVTVLQMSDSHGNHSWDYALFGDGDDMIVHQVLTRHLVAYGKGHKALLERRGSVPTGAIS